MYTFKKVLKSFAIILGVLVILVVSYVSYVWFQYYRIEDNIEVDIQNNTEKAIDPTLEYTITTYNIGFGAYDQEYSFFMDEGEFLDGTKTVGTYAKARSEEIVKTNTQGAINTINDVNPDFMFFQEVDTKARRSYYINQYQELKDKISDVASTISLNFHTAYLLYPFNDMMGKTEAGIVTLSKYKIASSTRRSFPLSDSKMDNLFDLDRCFSITRINCLDKELVLINVHMSAYDNEGLVREKQMELLNKVLEEEKNNYVIVGGDFNHILSLPTTPFLTEQKIPEWVKEFDSEKLNSSYSIVAPTNAPTCRSSDIPYQYGVNYFVVIDGFLINDNIELISSSVIDTTFKYSDHNPVMMKFKLK